MCQACGWCRRCGVKKSHAAAQSTRPDSHTHVSQQLQKVVAKLHTPCGEDHVATVQLRFLPADRTTQDRSPDNSNTVVERACASRQEPALESSRQVLAQQFTELRTKQRARQPLREYCSVRTGGQEKPETALQLGLDVKTKPMPRLEGSSPNSERSNKKTSSSLRMRRDGRLLHLLLYTSPNLQRNTCNKRGKLLFCISTGCTNSAQQLDPLQSKADDYKDTDVEGSNVTGVEFHMMLSRVAQHETTARTVRRRMTREDRTPRMEQPRHAPSLSNHHGGNMECHASGHAHVLVLATMDVKSVKHQ